MINASFGHPPQAIQQSIKMLNFFKDKEAVNFVDLAIKNIDFIKTLSYDLINLDDSEILLKNSNLIARCYVATYFYHLLEIVNGAANKEKIKSIKIELSKKIESDIFALCDEIKNHMALQDMPYVKQSCSWITNKLNIKDTLRAQAIAHQYKIFTEILSSDIWKSIGLTNYSTDGIIESFITRFSERDIAIKALVCMILADSIEIKLYEKYRNTENNNTLIIIKNLNKILQNDNIKDRGLLDETITRCDLLHHYARGIGDHMATIGIRMQKNCDLLLKTAFNAD